MYKKDSIFFFVSLFQKIADEIVVVIDFFSVIILNLNFPQGELVD